MTEISHLIKGLRKLYVANKLADSFEEINSGLCVLFAEEMESITFSNVAVLSNDNFIIETEDSDGWNGDGNDIWNLRELRSYGSAPPSPFGVEHLNQMISIYHCWIYFQGKHYDAECPKGVTNFFNLPVFKRNLDIIRHI